MSRPARDVAVKAPTCCHKHHTKWEKRRWHRLVRRAARQLIERERRG